MITRYLAEEAMMLQEISRLAIEQIFVMLEQAYCNDRRIFILGNGGSAATASHFALDLTKNTITPGSPRIKAISLTDHIPMITAWGSDAAYAHIFSEQLVTLLEPGDLVIGISASGDALNIINAVKFARKSEALTIGLLGARGGQLKSIVDAYVLAPGQNVEQEEDAHMILTHMMTRHMRSFLHTGERTLVTTLSHPAREPFYARR